MAIFQNFNAFGSALQENDAHYGGVNPTHAFGMTTPKSHLKAFPGKRAGEANNCFQRRKKTQKSGCKN